MIPEIANPPGGLGNLGNSVTSFCSKEGFGYRDLLVTEISVTDPRLLSMPVKACRSPFTRFPAARGVGYRDLGNRRISVTETFLMGKGGYRVTEVTDTADTQAIVLRNHYAWLQSLEVRLLEGEMPSWSQ